MIKHLTKRICEEMHYLPANNVAANFLVYGPHRAEVEIRKIAEDMREKSRQHGYCEECTTCLINWYRASCDFALREAKCARKIDQTYPAIVLPQCCNPEVN